MPKVLYFRFPERRYFYIVTDMNWKDPLKYFFSVSERHRSSSVAEFFISRTSEPKTKHFFKGRGLTEPHCPDDLRETKSLKQCPATPNFLNRICPDCSVDLTAFINVRDSCDGRGAGGGGGQVGPGIPGAALVLKANDPPAGSRLVLARVRCSWAVAKRRVWRPANLLASTSHLLFQI